MQEVPEQELVVTFFSDPRLLASMAWEGGTLTAENLR